MLEHVKLSARDDDDPPSIDFVSDTPTPTPRRAQVAKLDRLLGDVLEGRALPAMLAHFLTILDRRLALAAAWCRDTKRATDALLAHGDAYDQAREGIQRMRLACQQTLEPDKLQQGFAALESAVVDIDALIVSSHT